MTGLDDSSVPFSMSASAGSSAGPVAVSTLLALTLALRSAVPSFATDMHTPAFPQVTSDLATSASLVGPTLTAFFLGIAGGSATRRAAVQRRRDRLPQIDATADGAVGDPDPLEAIEKTLAQQPFDEIILSTLPPGISRWLALDLPHRIERRTDIPLTVIAASSGGARERFRPQNAPDTS